MAATNRIGRGAVRRLLGLTGAIVGAALALFAATAPAAQAAPPAPEHASVVLVITDDQRADALGGMRILRQDLIEGGTVFTDAFVSNPLCCPSRASILTGQYAHSTQVYRQIPPFGRFEWFDDSATLATWLDDAGYATGLFGKYLDGYQHPALLGYIPPGWDAWYAFVRSTYYDYKLSENGSIHTYGRSPDDYSTDRLASLASAFIRREPGPVFVTFAPAAPHAPAIPADRHADMPVPIPTRNANFNEADVDDKPEYISSLSVLDPDQIDDIDRLTADQHRTMRAVDEGIGRIIDALSDTGRLRDTLFVYTSDNGLLRGEHRWAKKEVPYEEAIRVPLVVRYDRLGDLPAVSERLVVNIDIAPTILDAAGVHPPAPWRFDGRSLLPVLRGTATAWRSDFLLEHMRGTNEVPTYCGIRTERFVFVEYDTGERELYDLFADPQQLRNLADDPAAGQLTDSLHRRLLELCRPLPPGWDNGRGTVSTLLVSFAALAALAGVAIAQRRTASTAGAEPARRYPV
ncbi:MAG: sulfatase [Actinomycetota bacterium]